MKIFALAVLCAMSGHGQVPSVGVGTGGGSGAPNASNALTGAGTTLSIAHTFSAAAAAKATITCYTPAGVVIPGTTPTITLTYPDSTHILVTFSTSQPTGTYCNANATGTGATGQPGTSPTVAVGSTTTASPGSPAAVADVGSGSNHTLNFTIPAGQPGSDGVDGENGSNGADALTCVFTFTGQSTRTFTYSAGACSDVAGTHNLVGPFRVVVYDSAGTPTSGIGMSGLALPSTSVTVTPGVAFTGSVAITGSCTAGCSTGAAGDMLAANNLSDLNNASIARSNIGLAIGSDVQAYDADLAQFAALSCTNGQIPKKVSGAWACAADDNTGLGGGGDASTNTSVSVDGEAVLFSGVGGKTLKRSTLTGIPKLTSGVQSAAVAGTDYVVPGGNVATASALAADPADCTTTGAAAHGVNAAGVATGCIDLVATYQPLDSDLTSLAALAATAGILKRTGAGAFGLATAGTDYVAPAGNVATATALAANGTNCSAGSHPLGIDASGNAEGCTADSGGGNMTLTSGSADPSGACTAGAQYLQTTTLDQWFCAVSGTWKKHLSTTNTGTYTETGTAGTSPCGTVATGEVCMYFDSTSKTIKTVDDAAATATMVRADTGASNNFVTAISAAGVISKAQPSSSNLSDASSLVKNNQANTFGAFKQTFTPSATVAGVQLTCAALPSSPANGDLACDSGDSNKVKVRSNGAWVDVASGGSVSVSSGSTGQFAKYTGANAIGGGTIGVTDLPGEYYCAPTGASGTAYSCAPTNTPTAWTTGEVYIFKADVANTGAATFDTDAGGSLTAKTIKKVQGGITTDLVANDIRAGQIVVTRYDGTNLQMISQLGNSASGSGDVVAAGTNNFSGTNTIVSGGTLTASGTGTINATHFQGNTTVQTSGLAANAVTSAKMAVVNTRRTCMLLFGADNATSALADADIGPQKNLCYIPAAATIVEVMVKGDAGTPSVLLQRRRGASTVADLLSGALATAASGAEACAMASTSQTCISGTTSSGSITLSNTSLSAGDWIETKSATAGGTAKSMSIAVVYTIN